MLGTGFWVDGEDCDGEADDGPSIRKMYKDCMPCIELHDRLTRLGELPALQSFLIWYSRLNALRSTGLDEEELEHPAFKQAGATKRILALLDEAEGALPRDELVRCIMAIADEAFPAFTGAGSTVKGEARG